MYIKKMKGNERIRVCLVQPRRGEVWREIFKEGR
jgi:hypothetical protein